MEFPNRDMNSLFSFFKTSKECLSDRIVEPFGYTLFAFSGILITWSATNITLTNILLRFLKLSPAWFLLVASVYVLNDVFDKELDKANNLDRPIATGRANPKHAIYLFLLLSISGLILSLTINFTIMLISSAFLMLGILYSLPPIRLKKRTLGKSLTLPIGFSLSLLAGGLTGGPASSILVFVTICIFVYVFFLIPLLDLKDIKGDKIENIKTLPTLVGTKRALMIGVFSYIILPISAFLGYLFLNFNFVYIFLLIFLSMINIHRILTLRARQASQSDFQKLRNIQVSSGILVTLIFFIGTI